MKRLIEKIDRFVDICISKYALAFANGSVKLICYYIFHQPEMPDELKLIEEE